ncbi:hypothetical protein Goshw_021267 [Gossypium schwendimanii]|uniref:RING-type E3 ubiquitin transferase n=1 Tax=Gossypium schwendimanii TaxID=34291 RepID=A0A7J9LQ54_GOSSC|nr:hypothetical protein [Gossypium schwendimanii]
MLNLSRCIFLCTVTVVVVAAQLEVAPREESYGLYSHFEPSMVIVIMILVCVFFFIGFLSIYIRQCKELNDISTDVSTVERYQPEGLDQSVIESFPVFIYSCVKDLNIGKGALECAVCLSEFEDDEKLRFLPKCSHVFHLQCIDAWLAYHVTCPVCRAKLTSDSDTKSNTTELNSNSNNINESSHPTTEGSVEERNAYVVIKVNEESGARADKIRGKFQRSHSTGHSVIQPGENVERFTLKLPEEIRKQITKRGKLKRTRSYDILLAREGEDEEK